MLILGAWSQERDQPNHLCTGLNEKETLPSWKTTSQEIKIYLSWILYNL